MAQKGCTHLPTLIEPDPVMVKIGKVDTAWATSSNFLAFWPTLQVSAACMLQDSLLAQPAYLMPNPDYFTSSVSCCTHKCNRRDWPLEHFLTCQR